MSALLSANGGREGPPAGFPGALSPSVSPDRVSAPAAARAVAFTPSFPSSLPPLSAGVVAVGAERGGRRRAGAVCVLRGGLEEGAAGRTRVPGLAARVLRGVDGALPCGSRPVAWRHCPLLPTPRGVPLAPVALLLTAGRPEPLECRALPRVSCGVRPGHAERPARPVRGRGLGSRGDCGGTCLIRSWWQLLT